MVVSQRFITPYLFRNSRKPIGGKPKQMTETKYAIVIDEEQDGIQELIPCKANVRFVKDGVWYLLSTGTADTSKPYRQESWLRKEYINKGQTLQQIGNRCGVSPMTINQWIVKHGIESRPRGRRQE